MKYQKYKKAELIARLFCYWWIGLYRNSIIISKAAASPIPQWMTPTTLVIGPVFPLIALSSRAVIITNVSMIASKLVPPSDDMGRARPTPVRCVEAPMKKSMGIENKVLVRDARPALPKEPAASGNASPPPIT